MLPVQFTTYSTEKQSHEESALIALQSGCRWIQLRIEGPSDAEIKSVALKIKDACREHDAVFVIADRIGLVQEIEADGIHLDKSDVSVGEVRRILGEGYIIGRNASTLEEIIQCKKQSADYVCCGPFCPDSKEGEGSPTLKIEDYQSFMEGLEDNGLQIPVCASGCITLETLPQLMGTGIQGIVISKDVLHSDTPSQSIRSFLDFTL